MNLNDGYNDDDIDNDHDDHDIRYCERLMSKLSKII